MPHNRVLVNSLPKSGTHLLTKALVNLGYREYGPQYGYLEMLRRQLGYGTPWLLNYRQACQAHKCQRRTESDNIRIGALTEYRTNPTTLYSWLRRLHPGVYLQGHLPFSTAVSPVLQKLRCRQVLILRDPRAVLASLLHYIPNAHQTDMGAHFLAADFAVLEPMQQLDLLLNGGYAPQAGLEIYPFAEVFRAFLAWRADPDCLVVHFEDLIGVQGGGSHEQQKITLQRIAAHLNVTANLGAEVYDSQSRTFRHGQIDGWQRSLNAVSVDKIQKYCAPLCAAMGLGDSPNL